MLHFFKRLKVKLLRFFISSNDLLEIINISELSNRFYSYRVQKCLTQVSINKNSRFYEQAEVHNFQNDKRKIIIGKNTHIRGKLLVFANGGKIQIGDNCYVGENTFIWSAKNIIIGNDVLISDNVHIIDTNSHEIDCYERADSYKKMLEFGHPTKKGNVLSKAIYIEDNAWISFGVSILKGVKIGKGAIIAAGSVVTKDVHRFCIVAGNPAKVIKILRNV